MKYFRHRFRFGILELELGVGRVLGGVQFEADTDSSGVGVVTCRNCAGERLLLQCISSEDVRRELMTMVMHPVEEL